MKVRAMFRFSELLMALRLAPNAARGIDVDYDKRQLGGPPGWMSKMPAGDIEVHDEVIDSRGGALRLRIYRAETTAAKAPTLFYIHGGGFVMGGLDGADHLCRKLALRTGAVVIAIEYRLAPQHPFPAALEDCFDALEWIVKTQPHDCDINRLAAGGDSAGGNLTASLMIYIRDN